MGIGYSCKNGKKSSPNQDDFFIIVDGKTVILGVFDGHGVCGHFCSYTIQQLFPKFLLSNENYPHNMLLALQETFLRVEDSLREIAQSENKFSILLSGSTASILVQYEDNLYIANVGDSRVVLYQEKEGLKIIPKTLSNDHLPNVKEEKSRIESKGGEIRMSKDGKTWRIFGVGANYPGITMSRVIGDEMAKKFGVTAEPSIMQIKVSHKTDLFVILASDGVWEVVSNESITEIVQKSGKKRLMSAAELISEIAFQVSIEKGLETTDDITCIIYYLKS